MTETDLTVESEIDVRTITHTNGDTTIVPSHVDDETAAQLAKLSGDELAAAIADVTAEKEKADAAQAAEQATSTVLADPPVAAQASTSDAGMAGPDPVKQGGPDAPVVDVPHAVPGDDAATEKTNEAADPTGGVTPNGQDDGPHI